MCKRFGVNSYSSSCYISQTLVVKTCDYSLKHTCFRNYDILSRDIWKYDMDADRHNQGLQFEPTTMSFGEVLRL